MGKPICGARGGSLKVRDGQRMQSLGDILKGFDWDQKKYISREFQDYGYRLAEELGDLEHKALYIKLAKEVPRTILEQARNYVKDASNARSRARLFMWRVKLLKEATRLHPVSRLTGVEAE